MSNSRASSASHRSLRNQIEKTLILIKPEAVEHAGEIEAIVLENGFDILSKRVVHMKESDITKLYEEHIGQTYFQNLSDHMTSDSVVAMCLSKMNAISDWKILMGPSNVLEARVYWPNSIRAKYGIYNYDGEGYKNAVHGSEDTSAAAREINHFFPEKNDSMPQQNNCITEYLQTEINSTLTKGLNELCKEKPSDPIVWLADWLLTHNPNSDVDVDENLLASVSERVGS